MGPPFPIPNPRSPIPAFKLAVLASGRGSNLQALIDARRDGGLPVEIVLVAGDKAQALALRRAETAGIPTLALDPRGYPSRAAYDADLFARIAASAPDLIVLAGFMKLFGATFLRRFGGRIVNTHPALLPSFPGAHGVRDALAYGVKVTGCTVMVVDEGIDTGPILAQATVAIEPGDDEATLHERIKAVEQPLLVEWVGRIARGGLRVDGRHAIVG